MRKLLMSKPHLALSRSFAFLGLSVVLSGAAQAAVTFEDLATPVPFGSTSPFTSGGLTFSTTSVYTVTTDLGFPAPNPGKFLAYDSGGTASFASAAPFNLLSLDLGGWVGFGSNPSPLRITGLRAAGPEVFVDVTVSPTAFSSYNFSGFTNLQSVRLGSTNGFYLGVDNIQVSPVPEPTTLAMLLAGVGLVGAIVRRRAIVPLSRG